MQIQKRENENLKQYQELLERISRRYVQGQAQAVRSVNEAIIETNLGIGKNSDDTERSFYYQQNLLENWSVTELKRQKNSGLFMRIWYFITVFFAVLC